MTADTSLNYALKISINRRETCTAEEKKISFKLEITLN